MQRDISEILRLPRRIKGIEGKDCFPPRGDSPEPHGTGRHISKTFGMGEQSGIAKKQAQFYSARCIFYAHGKNQRTLKPLSFQHQQGLDDGAHEPFPARPPPTGIQRRISIDHQLFEFSIWFIGIIY